MHTRKPALWEEPSQICLHRISQSGIWRAHSTGNRWSIHAGSPTLLSLGPQLQAWCYLSTEPAESHTRFIHQVLENHPFNSLAAGKCCGCYSTCVDHGPRVLQKWCSRIAMWPNTKLWIYLKHGIFFLWFFFFYDLSVLFLSMNFADDRVLLRFPKVSPACGRVL